MILKEMDLGFIEGVVVGKNEVELMHLQFAGNTLIFYLAKKRVILSYIRLLDSLSLLSSLTINYSKSALIPLGCE